MNALTLAILISVTGGAGEDLADSIVARGITKVGVIPSVISRKGDHESTVGSLGPRALTIAKDMQNQLVGLSTTGKYRGKFSVVSDRIMRRALEEANLNRSLTVDDLGDPRALKALSSFTGAEAFVALENEEKSTIVDADGTTTKGDDDKDSDSQEEKKDRAKAQKIVKNLIGSEGDEWYHGEDIDVNSLSSAAYMGDSFEIRRWDGDTLLNEGVSTPHKILSKDSHWEFGKGEKWEKEQYNYIKTGLAHPFDIDGFPYEVNVKVNGKVRKPERLRGKFVVALEEDEEYAIELKNDTDQPAMVALYIDGISAIDKELREPVDLENGRHWVLKPNYKATIEGWFTIGSDKEKPQEANRFKIVPRDDSVAGQKGFDGKIGMITAIFYANDAVSEKHINYPDDDLLDDLRSALPSGAFGTGTGKSFDKTLNFVKAKRGLLLAAVTIYYRTQEEIDDIKSGKSLDHELVSND